MKEMINDYGWAAGGPNEGKKPQSGAAMAAVFCSLGCCM